MSANRIEPSNGIQRTCTDVTIRVFAPDNSSRTTPDFTIPYGDVESIDLTERISDTKDQGTIHLHNGDGTYTDELVSGTRLDVTIETGAMKSWGSTPWGSGGWGGSLLLWTALVRDREFTYLGPNRSRLTLDCEDYVSSVLGFRQVFDEWISESITGPSGVLRDVIRTEARTEILTDRIASIPSDTTTLRAEGMDALDLVGSLARRAGAVFYGDRTSLVFEPLSEKTPLFDLVGADVGPLSNREIDQGLVNQIRVNGATDSRIDDEQLVQDSYATVSENSRKSFRVDTRKSSIDKLEVWTNRSGSHDSLRVRVQKDDGTGSGPIAPDDDTSDIVNRSLSYEFLDDDGYTTFQFGENTLPEPGPWVILETDGANGQRIGVQSSTGTPAYRSYYAYQVTVQQTDRASRDAHRRREDTKNAPAAESIEAANEIAHEVLDHDAEPEHEVKFDAHSLRTASLTIGDPVRLDFAREQAVGDYIVTERETSIENGLVDTTLSLQEISTV